MIYLLCQLLLIYMVVLFGRAILSWFPIQSGTVWASIGNVLIQLTEPVLAPLRRMIPPMGMFDVSFLVLFLGIQIIRGVVLGCGGI
ncbi:MAG: YggT family protein [Acidimicrobiia bacterium]